ncbi:DUF2993 domain-containing protein [Frankia sp. Cr1]|uniref:LmeA family phospholipid-binding protein n=1 Tax=Frankia sp. Cr1 TaxID=3073931 RepID=UPI002AD478D8|nr:DUF2993 domain-containing protein [Frankia sp. Cr1]
MGIVFMVGIVFGLASAVLLDTKRSADNVGHWQEGEQNTTGGQQPAGLHTAGMAGGDVGDVCDVGGVVPRPADTRPHLAQSPTRSLPPGGPDDLDARRWGPPVAQGPPVAEGLSGAVGLPVAEGLPAAEPPRRRRRRSRRRLLLIVLVLQVVVLSVVDRVGAHVAASQLVSQVQKSQHLTSRPEASVGGIPFLTQVMSGSYKDIGFRMHRIAVPDLCVDDINVHLNGVHVPLRKMISNDVKTVPIDRVVGSVRFTFTDLNAYLATQPGKVQLAPAGTGMQVSAPVDIPIVGQITVFGDVQASIQNNRLTIAPTGIGVKGLGALSIPHGAVQILTVTVPLSGLPMNLQLTSAKATSTGIEVTAEADHITLDATQTTTTATPPIRGC